jgi:hypothetical protein
VKNFRRRRAKARVHLFRGGAGPQISRQVGHERQGVSDRGEYREAAGAIPTRDLMRPPRYNRGGWCRATEYTTMQYAQLGTFFAAVAAWVVCGCMLPWKPNKKLPLLRAAVSYERQPGCFALEEESGGNWSGCGVSVIKEARPTL